MASFQDSDRLLADEDRLIRCVQKGDKGAFAQLVDCYYDRLYRWLYHLTRNQHTAEDLTQETFLKALAGMEKFRADSNFRAWLFRIAHNNWINQQRLATRQREQLPDNLPGTEDQPVEQIVERETRARLEEAIAQLPEEFRGAFLLRVEEGLSFRQIAAVLGLTEETARWRVFKARQKLLHALTPSVEQEKP